MVKLLGQLSLGFLTLLGGLYIGYLYLTSLNNGGNLLFLIVSLILTGVGIFFLIRSSKTDTMGVVKPTEEETQTSEPKESLFEKNSQLVSDWRKTEETKNKLKMIQISAQE